VRGTDEGIWRRLHLIPFTVTIAKEAVEKDFRERRLVPELAGILNWAIEGDLQYRRDGLNPPAVVRAATDDYRHDMDVVGQWIEECCVRDSNASGDRSGLRELLYVVIKRDRLDTSCPKMATEPVRTWLPAGKGYSWATHDTRLCGRF
jgi:hypothetical protein